MTVLFFIATIIFFLVLDWAIRRVKQRRVSVSAALPQPLPALRTPEGIFFSRSHTWLSLFPSGKIRLGIDDFLGNLFDQPAIRFLKEEGETVRKGDSIMELKEGDRSITVRSPLAGVIVGINKGLQTDPEQLRGQLFSEGWALMLRPQHLEELKNMLLGEESRGWMKEELGRLRDLLAVGSARTPLLAMQDGGMPARGLLRQLSAEQIERFDQEFLQVC